MSALRGELSSAVTGDGDSSMWTVFSATSGFSKFMVCPHGQREGSIFRDFVRTSLIELCYC